MNFNTIGKTLFRFDSSGKMTPPKLCFMNSSNTAVLTSLPMNSDKTVVLPPEVHVINSGHLERVHHLRIMGIAGIAAFDIEEDNIIILNQSPGEYNVRVEHARVSDTTTLGCSFLIHITDSRVEASQFRTDIHVEDKEEEEEDKEEEEATPVLPPPTPKKRVARNQKAADPTLTKSGNPAQSNKDKQTKTTQPDKTTQSDKPTQLEKTTQPDKPDQTPKPPQSLRPHQSLRPKRKLDKAVPPPVEEVEEEEADEQIDVVNQNISKKKGKSVVEEEEKSVMEEEEEIDVDNLKKKGNPGVKSTGKSNRKSTGKSTVETTTKKESSKKKKTQASSSEEESSESSSESDNTSDKEEEEEEEEQPAKKSTRKPIPPSEKRRKQSPPRNKKEEEEEEEEEEKKEKKENTNLKKRKYDNEKDDKQKSKHETQKEQKTSSTSSRKKKDPAAEASERSERSERSEISEKPHGAMFKSAYNSVRFCDQNGVAKKMSKKHSDFKIAVLYDQEGDLSTDLIPLARMTFKWRFDPNFDKACLNIRDGVGYLHLFQQSFFQELEKPFEPNIAMVIYSKDGTTAFGRGCMLSMKPTANGVMFYNLSKHEVKIVSSKTQEEKIARDSLNVYESKYYPTGRVNIEIHSTQPGFRILMFMRFEEKTSKTAVVASSNAGSGSSMHHLMEMQLEMQREFLKNNMEMQREYMKGVISAIGSNTANVSNLDVSNLNAMARVFLEAAKPSGSCSITSSLPTPLLIPPPESFESSERSERSLLQLTSAVSSYPDPQTPPATPPATAPAATPPAATQPAKTSRKESSEPGLQPMQEKEDGDDSESDAENEG